MIPRIAGLLVAVFAAWSAFAKAEGPVDAPAMPLAARIFDHARGPVPPVLSLATAGNPGRKGVRSI